MTEPPEERLAALEKRVDDLVQRFEEWLDEQYRLACASRAVIQRSQGKRKKRVPRSVPDNLNSPES